MRGRLDDKILPISRMLPGSMLRHTPPPLPPSSRGAWGLQGMELFLPVATVVVCFALLLCFSNSSLLCLTRTHCVMSSSLTQPTQLRAEHSGPCVVGAWIPPRKPVSIPFTSWCCIQSQIILMLTSGVKMVGLALA